MNVSRYTADSAAPREESLDAIIAELNAARAKIAAVPIARILAVLDEFSRRLLADERSRGLEGVAFLSAWLSRANLQKILELNLRGEPRLLDGFQPWGRDLLAAKPQGLVAMWMAGNVATLPWFSIVPALLTKNVALAKLAQPDPAGMERLMAVLADSKAEGLTGRDLLAATAVIWFDYRRADVNEAQSLAADVRLVWGGAAAIRAITALPRREHCVDIIFGPKYSIGLLGRKLLADGGRPLDDAIAGLVRDVAAFDQRACSAPQTIFVERCDGVPLAEVGKKFAEQLSRLPPKAGVDAYTTAQILAARAQWAMQPGRDVLASADANWTVCMDAEPSLKEPVQSRTVFLTEIACWQDVLPLLSPKIQTVGLALGDREQMLAFAEAATATGVARCVRPGLMNHFESPWDGKLLLSQLVRWVTLKP